MKNITGIITPRLLGAAIAAAALIAPVTAFAQQAPAYADGGTNQQIQGTVASINGTWNISVADTSGYTDSVQLQQGTIINPTGLTLEPGMNVTVDGYSNGSNFDALEIDTPYQYQGPAPVAVYYGAGAWYPGYASGWGPSFSLSFNLNTRSFQQRSFSFGGQVRQAMAPPSGWQNRAHGYIGNAGIARSPQRTAYAAPLARSFAAPQPQARSFAAPQPQARNFAAPQAPARSFAAPQPRLAASQHRSPGLAASRHPSHKLATSQHRNPRLVTSQLRRLAASQHPLPALQPRLRAAHKAAASVVAAKIRFAESKNARPTSSGARFFSDAATKVRNICRKRHSTRLTKVTDPHADGRRKIVSDD